MEYEMEGARPRGRTKEDLDKGCAKRLSDTQIKQGGCHESVAVPALRIHHVPTRSWKCLPGPRY